VILRVFGQLSANTAAAGCEEYLESAEKLRIFRRRYIVGNLTNKANISI